MRKRELLSMLINFSQKYTWLSKAALVSTPSKPPPPRNFVLFLCLCHQIMGKVPFLLSSWTVLETKPNCLSEKYTTQNVKSSRQWYTCCMLLLKPLQNY